MTTQPLPPAPSTLFGATGTPAFGMYEGIIPSLDWGPLALPSARRLTRRLHHKRWQYAAVSHDAFFLGMAVVDAGWTSAAFAYLFDYASGAVAASLSLDGIPFMPVRIDKASFGDARFERAKRVIAMQRRGSMLELVIRSEALRLDAAIELAGMPPVLASIAPANWAAHATLKTGALPAQGTVTAGDRQWRFDKASASLDRSDGLLARTTAWRWASAHRPGLGFNLQEGYMGDAENALWLDNRLYRLAAATFGFDAGDPLAPWTVRTADGLLDLVFEPCGARHENRDFFVAASRYVQPVGHFHGTVRDPLSGRTLSVDRLAGVTEDHEARW
ncbi:DUF2804 domain-containing protein [Paludibacterium paludis]|uniref:DUF2804 domain-containing protein n=1 Tax=Paludibacterium paludis TaxID=1225769 RepID=A0A918U9W8_9NEIS|nr:DUF2804 domain-containing protein [Paludibacterium paludis]GGY15895.1 DUF2804 domain-containing protein [Paludibacterium paludis]